MPPKRSTPKLLHRAWEFRREPTPAEAKLWSLLSPLRQAGFHFRRQHAIGSYITDLCLLEKKLIIELDGSPHRDRKEQDQERTAYFQSIGYRVLRFWNHEVLQEGRKVLDAIKRALEDS